MLVARVADVALLDVGGDVVVVDKLDPVVVSSLVVSLLSSKSIGTQP